MEKKINNYTKLISLVASKLTKPSSPIAKAQLQKTIKHLNNIYLTRAKEEGPLEALRNIISDGTFEIVTVAYIDNMLDNKNCNMFDIEQYVGFFSDLLGELLDIEENASREEK